MPSRPIRFTLRSVGKLWSLSFNKGIGGEISLAVGDLSCFGKLDEFLCDGTFISRETAHRASRAVRLLCGWYGRTCKSHSPLAEEVRGKIAVSNARNRRARQRAGAAAK